MVLFALAMSGPLAAYAVTGYLIGRYYGPWQWLILMAAVGLGASLARTSPQRDAIGALALQIVSVVALFWAFAPSAAELTAESAEFPRTRQLDVLHECLGQHSSPSVLFVGDDTAAARFGAVYGVRSVLMPRNLTSLEPTGLRRFIEARRITHLYGATAAAAAALGPMAGIRRVDRCAVPLFATEDGGAGNGRRRPSRRFVLH